MSAKQRARTWFASHGPLVVFFSSELGPRFSSARAVLAWQAIAYPLVTMSAPEAAEAPHTILDISTDSFVNVLLHVGAGARPSTAELCRLSGVCSGFRSTLADESTWQILCKWAWSVDDADLSSDWPRLASFRSLYAVLEVWAPRQGFHQLLDAYPWGALLLLSFRQGLFVGELIFHEPPSEEG